MRILHLAYEDPQQPGSGGGSVRTSEINRRLAARHEITAIVAGYPRARERTEEGVRWVPLSAGRWGKFDRLAYFALLHREVRRRPHDLVVEDFGAPFSVGLAPLATRRPVIASVQWLFARQMRAKYGLPFDWVERGGLRLYHDFIVVSDWLGAEVRARRPGARIATIPNGVEPAAFAIASRVPEHLAFVGRLDIAQKGCDLLLAIFARARALLGERTPPLLIIGDGQDRSALEARARQLDLEHLVRFVGRRDGEEKYRLLAGAHAVLMPSRFETFGMVAAESQAAAVPLVAFDVGPLAEVTGGEGVILIPPFDVAAFADAVVAIIEQPQRADGQRANARVWARRYDWDVIAQRQEEEYRRVVGSRRAP